MSLNSGEFPKIWKNAVIIPIPKISKPQFPNEYRPINTMPYAEKIFEKIVKKQVPTKIFNCK